MFGGIKIIVSDRALEATKERMFRESKNRSKRIHKKLVKRFGSEFRMVPCVWQTPNGFIAHPVMYDALRREVTRLCVHF